MTPLQPATRISLPSGGWWDLVTRPMWRHLRLLLTGARQGATAAADTLVDHLLVALTTAWSFDEPVSLDSLAAREGADMDAVVEVLCASVLPAAVGDGEVLPAAHGGGKEDLFRGLLAGRVPSPFAEVHILALTGWTWAALQETPVDVVARMAEYLAVRSVKDSGGTLQLQEHDHDPR